MDRDRAIQKLHEELNRYDHDRILENNRNNEFSKEIAQVWDELNTSEQSRLAADDNWRRTKISDLQELKESREANLSERGMKYENQILDEIVSSQHSNDEPRKLLVMS